MRKLFLAFMAVATFALVGCKEKNDDPTPQPQPTDDIILFSHQMGEPVNNPMNYTLCKDTAAARLTLSSLRRISDLFYYMDFAADMDFPSLVDADLRDYVKSHEAMEEKWFEPNGREDPFDEENPEGKQKPACSGFICFNEAGELLFGRNFDGAGGPLCMVFNKVNGTYDYVQFTAPNYNSSRYNGISHNKDNGDGTLSDDTTSLHRLLRQPLATMDGMNEHGLCFGAFQLPVFGSDPITGMPERVEQNTGKKAINSSLMHNLILSECKTVADVKTFLEKYDFVALHPSLNVHWMVADANGDYAVFEYWDDSLYVMDASERNMIVHLTSHVVPYEYNSIENYYCNPIATYSYLDDGWQNGYSSKVRVQRLMMSYYPIMSEMQALRCLQEGSFGVEMLNDVTNWSCIYNPKKRTILFCMRNDMSKIYKVDLNKDL